MRTTNILKLSALVLGTVVVGCGSNESSSGPGGVGGNTSTSATGGKSGTNVPATGGVNSNVGGGAATGGKATTGGATAGATGGSASTTGGKTGVGGTSASTGGKTGVGGAGTGGKTNVGGTSAGTGGKTGVGGANTNVGGANTSVGGANTSVGGANTSVGGSTAETGGSTGAPGGSMISDFEDTPGKGTIVPNPPVSTMDGYWYSFKESTCTNQKPVSVDGDAVATEKDGTNNAMHGTIGGCGKSKYSGFGVALHPTSSDGKIKGPVDLSAYDGVSFKIKGTSSTQIYVEFQTTDCIRSADGGTATSDVSDAYNCHGYLIKSVPTAWTQMYVPFGTTGVRWFPTSAGTSNVCTSSDFCEAPALDRSKIVDIQFALEGPFNELPTEVAAYDVWVDDLALYKFSDTPKDSGLGTTTPTYTMSGSFPFPANQDFGANCTKPTGADGKLLLDAYAQWKSKFVSGNKVVSPEIDNGATVSEGIAYGMLLAVYFGDKTLFDGLLSYLKSNAISGASLLMNWKQPNGNGSASDADEDAAFALQMARKQWGSAYDADASAILSQFLSKDVDSSGNLTAGSDFTSSGKGASTVWNPSYFAPAYYKYFATVDTANASKWNGLVTNGYTYLNKIAGTNGLVPAWCSGSCGSAGSGGLNYTDETMYQYDSHRMPFRTGLDACWNGSSDAKSYINKVVGFFAGKAGALKAAGGGLGTIGDIYNSGGTVTSNSANNSMSLLGCAGVGSMAYTSATFRDRVWSFLLEGHYTKNYNYTNEVGGKKPGYTYYNATVGLLTALAMSGNFYIMK